MDNDIKIFVPAEKDPCENLEELAAETEALRLEGTLDRAKRLGRTLTVVTEESPEFRALTAQFSSENPTEEQQLRVLTIFSGAAALRAALQPKLLAEAAVTAMNNYLINHQKEFWDTLSDGSAFTQYLLALRSPGHADPANAVGEAFARLCTQEDNPDLQQLGAAVFRAVAALVADCWGVSV